MEQLLQKIEELTNRVNELEQWKRDREMQQITYPLDESSKNAISEGTVLANGAGSTTKTQDISLTGNPQTITVPAAYAGTEKVSINGVEREIPYIA